MPLETSATNWIRVSGCPMPLCSFSYSKVQCTILPPPFLGEARIWITKLLYSFIRSPSITLKVIELFSGSIASTNSFATFASPSMYYPKEQNFLFSFKENFLPSSICEFEIKNKKPFLISWTNKYNKSHRPPRIHEQAHMVLG